MSKRVSVSVGMGLILMGVLTLVSTLVMPVLGVSLLRWILRRLWPVIVVSVGWCFVLPPLLVRGRRGLGGLFIPGIPILTTGAILLLASVFNWWHVWAWLWPLEVLSVAIGFVLAAIYMRLIWLIIPAIIIGANGLLFQFCALTGLWNVWAVMWTVEPLSVGLSLLIVGAKKRLAGLMLSGLIVCAVAGVGLVGMTAIVSLSSISSGWWLIRLLGSAFLVLVGVLLLVWSVARRSPVPRPIPR